MCFDSGRIPKKKTGNISKTRLKQSKENNKTSCAKRKMQSINTKQSLDSCESETEVDSLDKEQQINKKRSYMYQRENATKK